MLNWYRSRSNAFKAAVNTAWQTFLGVFSLTLFGWISDVQEWIGDTSRSFPAVTPLGKAFAAGAAAAASGLIAYLVRSAQAAKNPNSGPQYPTPVEHAAANAGVEP